MVFKYVGFPIENEEINIEEDDFSQKKKEIPINPPKKKDKISDETKQKLLECTRIKDGDSKQDIENKIDYMRNYSDLYKSISRLTVVLAMYFLEKGECYVKFEDIISDLANAKKKSRKYLFYNYASKEVVETTIRNVIYELISVGFVFFKCGNKFHYIPSNNKFEFTYNTEQDEYTELCIFDAIVKYNGCSEKDRRKLLTNATELLKLGHRDNYYIKSGLKPRFDVYNQILTKLRQLVILRNKCIKFKYQNKYIYFKVEEFVEYNNDYYIVGTELPSNYNSITSKTLLSHYNINDISEITEAIRKEKFNLFQWIENHTNLLDKEDDDYEDLDSYDENKYKNINYGKPDNIRIREYVDSYIERKICKIKDIIFDLLTPNYSYLPKNKDELEKDEYGEIKDYSQITQEDLILTNEDIKSYFGDLIISQNNNTYKISYNRDKFIKWAIPNYNCIRVHDEKLKIKIENIISKLCKNR